MKNKQYDTDYFKSYFENLFAKQENQDDSVDKFVNDKLDALKTAQKEPKFTLEELKRAIKHLKNNKAAGPDRIPAEIFKACPESILLIFLKLMNKILTILEYPDQWCDVCD